VGKTVGARLYSVGPFPFRSTTQHIRPIPPSRPIIRSEHRKDILESYAPPRHCNCNFALDPNHPCRARMQNAARRKRRIAGTARAFTGFAGLHAGVVVGVARKKRVVHIRRRSSKRLSDIRISDFHLRRPRTFDLNRGHCRSGTYVHIGHAFLLCFVFIVLFCFVFQRTKTSGLNGKGSFERKIATE